MDFLMKITLGNLSMRHGADIAEALRHAADLIEHVRAGGLPHREESILDANGNKVGRWWIKGEDVLDEAKPEVQKPRTLKLVWRYGDEAICPACGHGNACLSDGFGGRYTCRDCKRSFATITGRGPMVTHVATEGYLKGRKIVERECVEATDPCDHNGDCDCRWVAGKGWVSP